MHDPFYEMPGRTHGRKTRKASVTSKVKTSFFPPLGALFITKKKH